MQLYTSFCFCYMLDRASVCKGEQVDRWYWLFSLSPPNLTLPSENPTHKQNTLTHTHTTGHLVKHTNLELIVFNTVRVIRQSQGNSFALTHMMQVPDLVKKMYFMKRTEKELYDSMLVFLQKQFPGHRDLSSRFTKTYGLATHGGIVDVAIGCIIFMFLNTDDYFQADQAIRCIKVFCIATTKKKDEDEKKENQDEDQKKTDQDSSVSSSSSSSEEKFKPWFQRRWTLTGFDRVLTHPLSIPLLEHMASCASYLPFAVRILDNITTYPYGTKLLNMLLDAHMKEEEEEEDKKKKTKPDKNVQQQSANSNAHR